MTNKIRGGAFRLTGLILGNLAFFFGSQLLGIYAPGEPDVIQQGLVEKNSNEIHQGGNPFQS